MRRKVVDMLHSSDPRHYCKAEEKVKAYWKEHYLDGTISLTRKRGFMPGSQKDDERLERFAFFSGDGGSTLHNGIHARSCLIYVPESESPHDGRWFPGFGIYDTDNTASGVATREDRLSDATTRLATHLDAHSHLFTLDPHSVTGEQIMRWAIRKLTERDAMLSKELTVSPTKR
jgi:hypothetical protein